MSFKTTYILFGVLLAVVGVLFLNSLIAPRTRDQQAFLLPSVHDILNPVKADDIERIEIVRTRPREERLLFYRDDKKNWKSKEPEVRVTSSQVGQIVDQILRAKRDEHADMTADLRRFGLDVPAAVVTLTNKGGDKDWKVNLGDQSTGEDKAVVYVTSSDAPKEPMAVRRADIDSMFKSLNDFRARDLLAESSFDITAARLQEPQKTTLALEKDKESKWRFQEPAWGEADYEGEPAAGAPGAAAKITGVNELLQAIVGLRVETDQDFVTTGASDAEFTEKGVASDRPERLRIEIKRQTSLGGADKQEPTSDTLLIGKKADDKGEKLYARLESERNIVRIPAAKIEGIVKLLENPSAIRNRDLVQLDTMRIDAMDLQPHGTDIIKMRKVGETPAWKIFESGKPTDTDGVAVQGLLMALTNKRQVKDFPDPKKTDAELGLDRPSAIVSLWTDGIKKEDKKEEKKDDKPKDEKAKDEKKADDKDKKDDKKEEKKDPNAEPGLKDEKPNVRLSFGRKEKDLVFVKREVGGDVSRMAVPIPVLDKVAEGKLAYLDKKLPGSAFATDARRVVVERATGNFEIEKPADDKTSQWKFKLPKELAGRAVDASKVERLLREFEDVHAERYVAEKASDADLDRFGLKAPAYKLSISTQNDKKTEDFGYLLGKETDDKMGIYAKQSHRDYVFVLQKHFVDGLQGDFQDPAILKLDLAKIKGIKLTGWQDLVGSPFTLDLERKSATDWVVKTPKDFTLDVSQAENLITMVASLRAEKFVGFKVGAKPEHKFDLKDGGLEIAITVEGEKDPILLTVGSLRGTEGYLARSNKFPDEVFLLAKDRFEKVKSKPAHFKKEK